MSQEPIKCYYALGGINYKNGFVTSCPQQSDQLYILEGTNKISPSNIINSEKFKKHRLEMMSGTWSPGCHLCKEVEEAGAGKSMRHDFPADESFYNHETGEIDFKGVKHVELRFNNACNMACLHCSDVYSSGWMSKLKHYEPDEEDKKFKLVQLTKQMHRVSSSDKLSIDIDIEQMAEIVNDLNLNFPNLEKVDFAGGEVLYQKQFFPCLDLLSHHPNANNLWISFHTNFNAKADLNKLYNLLKKFKIISLMISVDAGTNIYPYFRTGDWEVLKNNLSYFKSLDVDRKMYLTTVVTTSIYQIMDIENIFMSLLELDIDRINSSIVYTPRYLNPSILNLNFKDFIKEDIKNLKYKIYKESIRRKNNNGETDRRAWKPKSNRFSDIYYAMRAIENIENYIANTEATEDLYEAFLVYVRKTDTIWNHKFNDYFVNYKFIDNKIVRV